MSYVVRAAPRVSRFLDRANTPTRDQYQQIVELLEEDPHPDEDFPYISERIRPDGTRFFRYFDDLFPYVVEYSVFPLDSTVGGMVWISEITIRDDEFLRSL